MGLRRVFLRMHITAGESIEALIHLILTTVAISEEVRDMTVFV
jgi:hypothetical protein